MKKTMLMGGALLVLSTSAFATQSRLLALGMNENDNDGMYIVSDARNVFLNPAYVNVYSDQMVMEWGNFGAPVRAGGTLNNSTVNSSTAPKAQGGVFKKYGDMVYGLYYGNESNTSALIRIGATSAAAAANAGGAASTMLQTTDNQLDLFVGGEAAVKWGANLVYASGKNESATVNTKDSAMSARLGAIGSGWDAHLNLSLMSKSELSGTVTPVGGQGDTITNESKGKLGIHAGGSYDLQGMGKVFGYYKAYNWEQTDSYSKYAIVGGVIGGEAGTTQAGFSSFYVGWGKDLDVNNGDKIYTSVAVKQTKAHIDFSSKTEVENMIAPVTLGYEAKATDWLTLRGSVVHNLYGMRDNKNVTSNTKLNLVARQVLVNTFGAQGKATIANSTAVNAGATLNFGKLSVDGLVGTTTAAGASGNTGVLSASNLQTTVGVNYKF